MAKKTFVVKHYEDFGIVGLVDVTRSDFDPANGRGVAHDMLQHPPLKASKGNSLANEFMAFGGFQFVLGENGKGNRYRLDFDDMAHSLISLISEQCFRVEEPHTLVRAPKIKKSDSYNYDMFNRSIYKALAQLIEWGADVSPDFEADEDGDYHSETYHFIADNRVDILAWLVLGYRYAANRFRRYDQYSIGELSDKIEKAVDAILVIADFGDVVVVSYNLTNCTCEARIDYNFS